jgi:hypothetical protein
MKRGRASVDYARRLTASLVSYVRGELPLLVPVDLGALVGRTMALVSRILPADIVLRTDVAHPAGRHRAAHRRRAAARDPGRRVGVEQPALNLMLNAVPPPGSETSRYTAGPVGRLQADAQRAAVGHRIDRCGRTGDHRRTHCLHRAGRGLGWGLGS